VTEQILSDEALAEWSQSMQLADELGLPAEWRVCTHCGEQSWRLAPHMFDPCPFVVEMANSAGLKFDAERMTAIRAGAHMEEMTRIYRALSEEEDEQDG
jgi:hypothetical protein